MHPMYSMLYTANLGLCDYVLFSQIRSHISHYNVKFHFVFINLTNKFRFSLWDLHAARTCILHAHCQNVYGTWM